jgi:hypothetical protein
MAEPNPTEAASVWAARFARLAMALSVLMLLLFLYTALRRLRYPFELDRMESAMMTSVWRLAHGQPLYTRPSLDWTPFLYAPLFFYASLAFSKIVGLSYAALRGVSLLATLGTIVVLYLHVLRETRDRTAALCAAGVYLSLYSWCLGWYDIGRVDSLSVFFFVLALYCMRFAPTPIAAVVWVLAFQTKQGFLPIGLLVFLAYWRTPKRMVLNMALYAVLAFASIRLMQHTSGGWYDYYVFGTVKQLAASRRIAILYLPFDLLKPLGIAAMLCVLAVLLRPVRWMQATGFFYAWITVLIVGSIGFARAHDGSNLNTVMPVYAWMAVLLGLALARLMTLETSPVLACLVWLMVIAQMAQHLYRPVQFDPGADTLARREAFLDILRATPGDVWLTNHSYDSVMAGKAPHAEMDALDAALDTDPALAADVRATIAQRHFTAIFLDRVPDSYSPHWLFNEGPFAETYGRETLAPMSRVDTSADQPALVYLPCDVPASTLEQLQLTGSFARQGVCPSGAR